MAMKRFKAGAWEYTFKRAGVLDKPLYLRFKSESEGDEYARKLEALLARGIVPTEHQKAQDVASIAGLIVAYLRNAHVKPKDQQILAALEKQIGKSRTGEINSSWVDRWVTDMKRVDKLAPSTIRSKVGALARCTDWGVRKGYLTMPDHPLRTLPDGYAQYTSADAAIAKVHKVDIERDRRLENGEHEKILAVIDAGTLPRKQRPYKLQYTVAIKSMYLLAFETAMRLREMYTLTVDQVDIPKRTVFLDKTKNGDKRQVPLSTVAVSTLTDYMKIREMPGDHPQEMLFPWWNGDRAHHVLTKQSDYISKLYGSIFEAAGCSDLKFHDLRHEATSRLFERTTMSETELMKVTGHKTHRMIMRYANLRGSDLASKLW